MDIIMKQRTDQQNKSLHLWFSRVADELNSAGLDMRTVLKPGVSIPWTSKNIKEYLFRPIMQAQLGKDSTTELTTKEIDQVFDVINRHLGEKFGVHVPFPSEEEIINSSRTA